MRRHLLLGSAVVVVAGGSLWLALRAPQPSSGLPIAARLERPRIGGAIDASDATFAVVSDGAVESLEGVESGFLPAFGLLARAGGRAFHPAGRHVIPGGSPSSSPCGIEPSDWSHCWFANMAAARPCLEKAFTAIGGSPRVRVVVEHFANVEGCFDGDYIYVSRGGNPARLLAHELGHQEGTLCDEIGEPQSGGAVCGGDNCAAEGWPHKGCGNSSERYRFTDDCLMGRNAPSESFCLKCEAQIAKSAADRSLDAPGVSDEVLFELTRDQPPREMGRRRVGLAPQTVSRVRGAYVYRVRADGREGDLALVRSADRPFTARTYRPGDFLHDTIDTTVTHVRVRVPPGAAPLRLRITRTDGPPPASMGVTDQGPFGEPFMFEDGTLPR